MIQFRCTYAFDRDTIETFVFENDIDDMEEAVGLALNNIAADAKLSTSDLLAFSVLRLIPNPPSGDDGSNPPYGDH